MKETAPIGTWELLQDFGFEPDAGIISDPMPGLTLDFGNCKLLASRGINTKFAEVVTFSGVFATPRTVVQIEFEMPIRVTSREQCAAWIAWHLDETADGHVFVPTRAADWLAEGRRRKDLLPWI